VADRRQLSFGAALSHRGMPWWSGFRPFAFPFFDLSVGEWLVLVVLGITGVALMAHGLS